MINTDLRFLEWGWGCKKKKKEGKKGVVPLLAFNKNIVTKAWDS